MRKVVYVVDSDGYKARSLSRLRFHIEFFNYAYKRNAYDGDFVRRFYFREGSWHHDEKFLRRISVINGWRNFSAINNF